MQEFQGQQKLLLSMGFTDTRANHEALTACGGQFQQAVAYLTNPDSKQEIAQQALQSSSSYKLSERYKPTVETKSFGYTFPPLDRDQTRKVAQVAQLGFDDQGKIRHALDLANWDVEIAITMVLDDDGRLLSDYSAIPKDSSTFSKEQYHAPVHQSQEEPMQYHGRTNQPHPEQQTSYIFPKLTQDRVQKVLQVANAGFQDEGKIRHALELCSWNSQRAISVLNTNPQSLRSDYSALNSIGQTEFSGTNFGQTQQPNQQNDSYSLFRQVNPHEDSIFDHPNSPV